MKQLGNLAVVAANHKQCMLQIYDEDATVHTGCGNERKSYTCNVWDDQSISAIIAHLNFGKQIQMKDGKCYEL